jgi:hypothetical protein
MLAPFGASAQEAAVPAFKQLDSMEARPGLRHLPRPERARTNSGYYPRIAGSPRAISTTS